MGHWVKVLAASERASERASEPLISDQYSRRASSLRAFFASRRIPSGTADSPLMISPLRIPSRKYIASHLRTMLPIW
ncbi:unnamed protein product [Lasius platythorax]|uniref:Uncharacterized protein n=1 Tax=Lasius platythorax TaxID=488582 RepID=A0AAV2P978_9HYME